MRRGAPAIPSGETGAAPWLLRSVGPGMLLLWDRDFHSRAMVSRTLGRGAHFLERTKASIVFRPIGILGDGSFLVRIYPTPYARSRDLGGTAVRVIEYALDAPAGPEQRSTG